MFLHLPSQGQWVVPLSGYIGNQNPSKGAWDGVVLNAAKAFVRDSGMCHCICHHPMSDEEFV